MRAGAAYTAALACPGNVKDRRSSARYQAFLLLSVVALLTRILQGFVAQKIEVGAEMGLLNVRPVQPLLAATRGREKRRLFGAAALQLALI